MRPRPIARAVMLTCACYLALVLWPVTNVHGWQGGWNPAGRFMLPLVPLVALALPAAFAAVPRAALIVLLALQIFLDAYLWQNPKNLWNDGDGVAAICSGAADRDSANGCRRLGGNKFGMVDVRGRMRWRD